MDRQRYQSRLIKMIAFMVILIIIAWVITPNIVITLLAILTCFFGLITFVILFRGRDSVFANLAKTPNGAFEVLIKGADFEIENPSTVYFGVTYHPDGNHVLRLAFPTKRKTVVLEEALPNGMILAKVPEFKLPSGAKKAHHYVSKNAYPGDLTAVVKFLGFV